MSDEFFKEPVSVTCKCGKLSPPLPRAAWAPLWQSYLDTGFFPVMCDDGGSFRLCSECTNKVREAVKVITEVTKDHDFINFSTLKRWIFKEISR